MTTLPPSPTLQAQTVVTLPQPSAQPASPIPTSSQVQEAERNYNIPPAVLLLGPPGSGKTDSVTTVLQHPSIEKLVVLGTEPRFHESLIDAIDRRKLDRKKLAYHFTPPTATPIS